MSGFRVRIQTGIAQIDGKWHVIQRTTKQGEAPQNKVYDPPFDTEAEAEAKAAEVARMIREVTHQ